MDASQKIREFVTSRRARLKAADVVLPHLGEFAKTRVCCHANDAPNRARTAKRAYMRIEDAIAYALNQPRAPSAHALSTT
jgi:hypothetical protein